MGSVIFNTPTLISAWPSNNAVVNKFEFYFRDLNMLLSAV